MKLTFQQKLQALEHKYYHLQQWTPVAGDLYTTSRADLEVYEIVAVTDDAIHTKYTEGGDSITSWPIETFLAKETFGYARVHIPKWIINSSG